MEELDLIKQAQAGDREAITELLRSIEQPVYQTAYYMLGNEQDAMDAAQEALFRVYTHLPQYERKARFSTWAQRITTNLCIDKLRRRQEQQISIDQHELVLRSWDSVEQEVAKRELRRELGRMIQQLPEHYRSVVLMRYVHDLSYQEIAETLDLPINTVKSHLFRARKQLQMMLQKGGISHEV